MNRTKWLATFTILALVVIALVYTTSKHQSIIQEGVAEGEKAPNFTLKNLSGESIQLSDYAGKKILLNFWASWCGPCQTEMPDLQKASESNQDYIVLGINVDPENDIAGFIKEYGLTFPNLLDENQTIQNQYKVMAYPTSFFIDEKQVIQKVHTGTLTYKDIEETFTNL